MQDKGLKDELLTAWTDGIPVHISKPEPAKSLIVRVALTCVACDIPATRKVCGFLGHRASLACNKCYKVFKQIHEDNSMWTNFSGFDKLQWVVRTNDDHRKCCQDILDHFQRHGTKSALKEAESMKGLRYSILLELPYFNPIRYPVIDPMHNLFLGTGKHVMEIWLNDPNILSKQSVMIIEETVQKFVVPEGIGRLPNKITAHFGGFTADQWRNWIIIYSSVLLRNVLEKDHWDCWIMFVKAVKLFCGRIVKLSDVARADSLMQQFCVQFERLYGEKACTVNMHLHLHLYQSILDYGPTYGFWLYAFERYNGILGSYHTNNNAIESQIMRKFLETQFIGNQTNSFVTSNCDFQDVLPKKHQSVAYATNQTLHPKELNIIELLELPFSSLEVSIQTLVTFATMVKPIGPYKEKVLSSLEVSRFTSIFNEIFEVPAEIKSKFYLKFGKLMLGDDLIGSSMSNSSPSSSLIMANWPTSPFSQQPVCSVGKVQYFLEIAAIHDHVGDPPFDAIDANAKYYFAFVHWYQPHQNKDILPAELLFCVKRFHILLVSGALFPSIR